MILSIKHLTNTIEVSDRLLYEKIFDQHYSRLRYYAYRILNSYQDSEEVVIDSFMALHDKWGDFPSQGHSIKFLNVCVHNKCLTRLGYNKRKQTLHIPDYLEDLIDEPLEIDSHLVELIYKNINELPPQRKRIMELLFIEGKKIAEIAQEMNIAIKTVKNQRGKAIDSIKLYLGH